MMILRKRKESPVTRRLFSAAFAAMSLSMVAIGYGVPTAVASSPTVTLTYANFTAATIPGEKALVLGFEKTHPGIHINLEELPLSNYETNLELETRVHKAPDIMQAIPEWLFDLNHAHVLLDLSSQSPGLTQKFLPSGRAMVTQNGHMYGAPFRIGESAVFVNPALFKAAHVPIPTNWTWAQFLQDAKKLTNAAKGIYGFAAPVSSASSDLGSSWTWLTMLFSYGGLMVNGNKAAFDNAVGVRALTDYVNMYKAGVEPPSELTWITNDVVQAFCHGKVAMWLNGPWYITTIQSSCPKLAFDTAPVPKGTMFGSDAGGTFIGVSSETPHPKQAMEFVNYMTSTPVLTKWAKAGQFLAPVQSVLSAPYFAKQNLLAPYIANLAKPGVHFDSLTPDNTALLGILQTAIQKALSGTSPATALHSAAAQWDAKLAHPY